MYIGKEKILNKKLIIGFKKIPMIMNVTIKCIDRPISIPLPKILNYDHFKKQLSNIMYKTIHKDEYSADVYIVPHISVDCLSGILLILLSPLEYEIQPGKYNDTTIDVLLFNHIYDMNQRIMCSTWNFNPEKYMDLLLFIKQKLPQNNAFTVIIDGKFYFWKTLLEYSFELCAKGNLYELIIGDLFQYLDYGLYQECREPYDIKLTIKVLDCIIWCCMHHFEEFVKEYIDSEKIKKTLEVFVKRHEIQCTTERKYNEKAYNLVAFEFRLMAIFKRLTKMMILGLINMNVIGDIENYRVYK